MKKITLIIILLLSFLLVSCENNKENFEIITTSFFENDIVNNITKNKLKSKSLISPGVDLHDYRPTSKEMREIKQSKLFIFTSYNIHHWLNNNVETLVSNNTIVINLNDYNNLNYNDLHYWTDPYLILEFINIIKTKIIEIDPTNKEFYNTNATNYYNKIKLLISDFESFLKNNNVEIYFAGHNSMYYFEQRFKIKINALSNTNKPDADLTSKQITDLINQIKNNNIRYLYIEELVEPKIAKTIQRELKKNNYTLNLLLLHGYHNISKEDSKNNVTYYDLFKQNIENIKKGVN